MVAAIRSRAEHVHEVLVRHLWWLLSVGLFGVVGGALTWRDELLPQSVKDRWRVLGMLPHWSWGWWVLAIGIPSFGLALESSFRLTRRLQGEIAARDFQLEGIKSERLLIYRDAKFSVHHSLSEKTSHATEMELHFDNLSPLLVKFYVKAIRISCDELEVVLPKPKTDSGFCYGGRSITYFSGSFVPTIQVFQESSKILVIFEVVYDSVPPLKERGFGKSIEFNLTRASTDGIITSVFLDEQEW